MSEYKEDVITVRKNISVLSDRLSGTVEQLDICASQLFRLVTEVDARLGADDVYTELCRLYGQPDGHTKAVFCRLIAAHPHFAHELAEKNLFGFGESALPGTHGKIAYVRNKRNDEAFLSFADRIRGAKAHYCASFSEACEAVFDNVCEFCILPVENNTDGKLYSFYSMIDRYELRLCDVTHMVGEDGTQRTVFALVARTVTQPKNKNIRQRFEFSVALDGTELPYDIIVAVRTLGGDVSSVGTQPVPYDDTGNKYYFTVDIDGRGALAMAFYMSREYPRYTPLGLYQIKN